PFICYGSLYWLPWSRDPCRKLLAVPLNSTSHSSIKVSSQIDPFLIGGSHWCWPAMIGLNVFYYLYNPKKRTGYICQLECYKKLWKVLSADMLEHTIVGHTGESMIKASPIDGRIYVHGDCTEPNCPDKAHIFVINFKRESTTHIGPKLEKMSISDSVSNHSDDLKSRSSEEPLVNLSTAHSAEKKQDQNDKALLSPTRRDIVGKPLGENAGLRRVK
uniref:C2H2-type domain-containing protein n=1 Tax=Plectus sambesii TaxID=2011161 RepID=A0A914XIN6_9BILA